MTSHSEIALQSQHGSLKPIGSEQNIEKRLSARNRELLTTLLEQVCALQKQYGKTPAELDVLVEGFSWVLSDYKMPKILEAMRIYIKKNSDIPAPADIAKIIDESLRPPAECLPIEALKRFREKGIPLTEIQKQQLAAHEGNAA